MTAWNKLERELDAWQAAGRIATFWWRDDDATTAPPTLDRMVELAEARQAPLALAVVPAPTQPDLVARVQRAAPSFVSVIQHGYAHANHAAPGAIKAELGADRAACDVLAELEEGRKLLAALFGPRFVTVLAPPWNAIDQAVVRRLPDFGYLGVSTFGPRRTWEPPLRVVNTHVDIMQWHPRGFVGLDNTIAAMIGHLVQRRAGSIGVDPEEPTGLLTHHRLHDEACWGFLEEAFDRLSRHPAARWVSVAEAFRDID